MSISISAWLGNGGSLAALPTATEQQRASLAWRRINDKKTSIVFRPPVGADLTAQYVRLEMDNRSNVISSDAGSAPRMQLIVYGVRNHALKSSTVPDTNMAEGYRFVYAGDEYRIDDVILQLGEIQGVCTATG